MVWWTSLPSGAFLIVQRRQSGWVNWGSNAVTPLNQRMAVLFVLILYMQFMVKTFRIL